MQAEHRHSTQSARQFNRHGASLGRTPLAHLRFFFVRSDGNPSRSRDGRKATVTPVKASLGPIWGGAIRLQDPDPGQSIVIGEGIETSASAGCLMGLPAWAAISAGNLANALVLPPEVRRVVIAADPDDAGRRAARDAWIRWTAEGRKVRIALPDGAGDFNDLLLAAAHDPR